MRAKTLPCQGRRARQWWPRGQVGRPPSAPPKFAAAPARPGCPRSCPASKTHRHALPAKPTVMPCQQKPPSCHAIRTHRHALPATRRRTIPRATLGQQHPVYLSDNPHVPAAISAHRCPSDQLPQSAYANPERTVDLLSRGQAETTGQQLLIQPCITDTSVLARDRQSALWSRPFTVTTDALTTAT